MFPQQSSTPTTSSLLSFGIPSLDEILGGGIPRGTNVLIEDEIGSEAIPFILHFLAEGLRAGEYGYILSTDQPFEFYAERLAGLGVNPDILEATGRLKYIDAFSNPFGYSDIRSEHQYTIRNLGQPREINEIIRRVFLHVQDQSVIKRGVVNSLSSIIFAVDESKKVIFSFLQNRMAANKRDGAVTLFVLHHDAHAEQLVKAIEHLCDVTIRVSRVKGEKDRPITEVRVINIKGKPELSGEPVYFEFISGKISSYHEEELF